MKNYLKSNFWILAVKKTTSPEVYEGKSCVQLASSLYLTLFIQPACTLILLSVCNGTVLQQVSIFKGAALADHLLVIIRGGYAKNTQFYDEIGATLVYC